MKVFVAGCGRSGTTYLKTLLDAGNDIFIPAETLCLYDYLMAGDSIDHNKLLKLFFDEPQLMSWFKGEKKYDIGISEAIDYVHLIEMDRKGAKVWGQKTPRFVRYIDLFNKNYNDIKWVLVYRDPRSVVNSMLKSGRHTYSVEKAVNRWKMDNKPIIDLMQEEKVDNKKYHFVKYENLVQNFDDVLTQIFAFLGIRMPCKEQMLSFDYGKTKSRDMKGFRFERNEIREGLTPNEAFLESWRTNLKSEQIGYIEARCKKEMLFYGYEKSSQKLVSTLNPVAESLAKLRVISIVWEYLTKWPEYLWKSQRRKILFKIWKITNPINSR